MDTDSGSHVTRWVVVVLVVVAIVLLVAWARRNPPFDDRVPDPESSAFVLVMAGAGGV